MTVQGKSKLLEEGTKLGFPLDCHIIVDIWNEMCEKHAIDLNAIQLAYCLVIFGISEKLHQEM